MPDFSEIFDSIGDILEAYSATLPTARRYVVHRDFFRDIPATGERFVFMFVNNIRGAASRGGGRGRHYELTTQYYLDCIAVKRALRTGGEVIEADERAAAETRRLVLSVLAALYNSDGIDLAFSPGEIGSRPFPQIDFLALQSQSAEKGVFAGRITLEINSSFDPEGVQGTPLEAVTADLPLASAEVLPDTGAEST